MRSTGRGEQRTAAGLGAKRQGELAKVRVLASVLFAMTIAGCGAAGRGSATSSSASMVDSALVELLANAPSGAPYSHWEHAEHLRLLKSHGFSESRESWRAAATTGVAPVRAAACALLVAAPTAADKPVLAAAAQDAVAVVRAWAELGQVRLGDLGGVQALRAIAAQPVSAKAPAPLVAATALVRLGDRAGVRHLVAAMDDEALRGHAARRIIDVARLDEGAALALFARALGDARPQVRTLALAQLEELRAEPSRSILQDFAERGRGDEGEKVRAQKILAALDR